MALRLEVPESVADHHEKIVRARIAELGADKMRVEQLLLERLAEAVAIADRGQARIAELEKRLSDVAALHDPYEGPHTHCHGCGELTPCETRRMATAAREEK
jgi:hypothetical protein